MSTPTPAPAGNPASNLVATSPSAPVLRRVLLPNYFEPAQPTTAPIPAPSTPRPAGRPRLWKDDAHKARIYRLRKLIRDAKKVAALKKKQEREEKRAAREAVRAAAAKLKSAEGKLVVKVYEHGDDEPLVTHILRPTSDELKLTNEMLVAAKLGVNNGIYMTEAPQGRGLLVTGGYDSTKVDIVNGMHETDDGRVRPQGSSPSVDEDDEATPWERWETVGPDGRHSQNLEPQNSGPEHTENWEQLGRKGRKSGETHETPVVVTVTKPKCYLCGGKVTSVHPADIRNRLTDVRFVCNAHNNDTGTPMISQP
jgi:hypothetical protein